MSLSTVLKIEKDRNVRRDMWLAVESALATEESARGLPSLEGGLRAASVPYPSPLNFPVTPASTNRETFPKGGGEGDAAATRLRELEDRIERQDAEIQELRDMYKRLARIAIKRAESGKAASDKTRRGKSDR